MPSNTPLSAARTQRSAARTCRLTEAARILGVSRVTIWKRITKHGIEPVEIRAIV
ncbi:MAG: helix-turn-helix domain-containing protein [Desulfobacterales bacterium]